MSVSRTTTSGLRATNSTSRPQSQITATEFVQAYQRISVSVYVSVSVPVFVTDSVHATVL